VADACSHTLAAYQVWLRTHVADFQTGLIYLKMAAEFGHVPACLTLGKLFHDGANVERDASAALAMFEKAAAEGSGEGWNSLGVCHEESGNFAGAQRCYRSVMFVPKITSVCFQILFLCLLV
jgi:TPR repeat protein